MGVLQISDPSLDNARTPSWLTRTVYGGREWSLAHARRVVKGREVTRVSRPSRAAHRRIVAIMVVKNEAPRFPFLLDYYRRAGIDHFYVIDNGSTDGLADSLRRANDVTCLSARGSYGASRYGNDWVNHVAARYCVGAWVLYVDADEFLVTSDSPLDLPDVCNRLEAAGRRALHAVMLDMYSDHPAGTNVVADGVDPLQVCDLYDREGYRGFFDPLTRTTWIKGGVRGRLFFDDIHAGPALNKTPLVKWRRGYAFAQSAHRLVPAALNRQDPQVHAALLHFKFTAASTARLTDPAVRSQHTDEYSAYGGVAETGFVGPPTARYTSPAALVDDRLIASLDDLSTSSAP